MFAGLITLEYQIFLFLKDLTDKIQVGTVRLLIVPTGFNGPDQSPLGPPLSTVPAALFKLKPGCLFLI